MSVEHRVAVSWTRVGGGSLPSVNVSGVGDVEINGDYSFASNVVNEHEAVGLLTANLKLLYLLASRDMTIKTNDPYAPDDTIVLTGGVPFFWAPTMPGTNPISNADVADLYVTPAAGTGPTTLNLRAVQTSPAYA